MFGLYFGNYLVEKNKISGEQLNELMRIQQNTGVKLGTIAVTEKLLTPKQAEEINNIQKNRDRRFGDIAIEKGYLLREEVNYLLNMQGNSYLRLIQQIVEHKILSMEEIEQYLEDYKNEYNLSETDLEALKSDDLDRIIPVFAKVDAPLGKECMHMAIRNVIRFIHKDTILKKAYKVKDYAFSAMASQQMAGDCNIFVGFAGRDKALLAIASPFAKEDFKQLDEDAFDSVCEFINCTNGLYASRLSREDIQIDMSPPQYHTDKRLTTKGDLYVVPLIIHGEQADVVVAVNDAVAFS